MVNLKDVYLKYPYGGISIDKVKLYSDHYTESGGIQIHTIFVPIDTNLIPLTSIVFHLN